VQEFLHPVVEVGPETEMGLFSVASGPPTTVSPHPEGHAHTSKEHFTSLCAAAGLGRTEAQQRRAEGPPVAKGGGSKLGPRAASHPGLPSS